MISPAKILIVEDEIIIGANISLQLITLGYEVSGIIPRSEEALINAIELVVRRQQTAPTAEENTFQNEEDSFLTTASSCVTRKKWYV